MKTSHPKLVGFGSRLEHAVSSFSIAEKSLDVGAWLAKNPTLTAIIIVAAVGMIVWWFTRTPRVTSPVSKTLLIEQVRGRKWAIRSTDGTTVLLVNTKRQAAHIARQLIAGRDCVVHVRNGDGSHDYTITPDGPE